jgi:hypothetical protein
MSPRRLLLAAAAVLALATACAPSTSDDEAAMPEHATTAPSPDVSPELTAALGKARAATAKYVANLGAAEADGYHIITKMMPGMGYHYLNPAVTDFDVTKPAILVYVKDGTDWQLGALEWVWPEQPAAPPLDGATYGSFDAACHYQDGTFVPAAGHLLFGLRASSRAELVDGQPAPAPVLRLDLFDHDEGAVHRLVQHVEHQLADACDQCGLLFRGRRVRARCGALAGDLDRDDRHRLVLPFGQWPAFWPPSTCRISPVTNGADSR